MFTPVVAGDLFDATDHTHSGAITHIRHHPHEIGILSEVLVECIVQHPAFSATFASRTLEDALRDVSSGYGRRLYVVRNELNQIDVVKLSARLAEGEVVRTITSDLFDVPTTVAKHGNRLLLVNARFGIPDPDTAEFDLVQVPIR